MGRMNDLIAEEHSKRQTEKISKEILAGKLELKDLVKAVLDNREPEARRAAWVLTYIAEQAPGLVNPYIPALVKNMSNQVHTAIIRNTLKCLEFCDIPESVEGELADLCFDYISGSQWTSAIQAFAMTIIERLCERYPELAREFFTITSNSPFNERPAFKARARMVGARLRKLQS